MTILNIEEKDKLFKKLFLYVVGLRDIKIAEWYFSELKGLPDSEISNPNNVGKTYAFVVSYGRIFHENEGIGKLKIKSFMRYLTPHERVKHNSLMKLRNQIYAHNDPQHNHLFIYYNAEDKKIIASAQTSYFLFSRGKDEINSLLNKIQKLLEEERDKLLEKLYPQKQFELNGVSRAFTIIYHEGFIERQITDKG